jgi:hypothetical protein
MQSTETKGACWERCILDKNVNMLVTNVETKMLLVNILVKNVDILVKNVDILVKNVNMGQVGSRQSISRFFSQKLADVSGFTQQTD